jgi:hypothetical protein
MNIQPKTKGEWFDILPFALKAWVTLAFPAAIISVRWMSPASSRPYQELLRPILVGYSLACVLLFGVGVVHVRMKSKKALWDFFFALIALIYGMLVVQISDVSVK